MRRTWSIVTVLVACGVLAAAQSGDLSSPEAVDEAVEESVPTEIEAPSEAEPLAEETTPVPDESPIEELAIEEAPPTEVPVEEVPVEEAPAVEAPPVEAVPVEAPPPPPPPVEERVLQEAPAASSTATAAGSTQSSAAHLCKVEAEEALKLLTGSVWQYGGWVYSFLGEHPVENGVAECKLICDADESCHRWVYDCHRQTCRYHDYGGMLHDADSQYSFVGEAKDIAAKDAHALERKKEMDLIKAKDEEAGRIQAAANKRKEQEAAVKAKTDVEAAEKKAAAMVANRRLAGTGAAPSSGAGEL